MKFLIKNLVHQSGANEIIKAIQNQHQKYSYPNVLTQSISIHARFKCRFREKKTDDIKIIKAHDYKI